jgi:TPR repeat protein
MNIELDKKIYKINKNEFSLIVHNEYSNLIIRENFATYERIISLLKDLSSLSKRCIFFSQSHGGVIPINVASNYDKIYLLNNVESQINNLRENIKNHNIQNVDWEFDLKNENENENDNLNKSDFIIFSEKCENIDETIIEKYQPIILTNLTQKLLKKTYYENIYELSNSNLALYIPSRFKKKFISKFHYYIKDNFIFYDNLINLCILVKNGGKQFENMLNENMHLIDRWTILDTGSTDETIDIINKVLIGKKRGELYQEPFINFCDSRNRLLELAGDSCKYTLMLDDTYIIKGDLRGFLNEVRGDNIADSYSIYIKSDDVEYASNRILKCKSKLRYLYKIHEVVQSDNNVNIMIPNDKTAIFDGRFDYMEERTMNRKQLDLKLLYEEIEDDPNNPRTYYYLGQTYNILQDYEKSYFYFLKRMNHTNDGFLQEKIDAIFEAARIANFKLNKEWSECEKLYLKAYEYDNTRPDSLYFLGIHYYFNENKKKAFEYFKRAFEVGYPIHAQYSLKPTLSYRYVPKILCQLCYEFTDWILGEKACKLYLEHNTVSDDDSYIIVHSLYNIFVKLNAMNSPLENIDINNYSLINSNKNEINKPLLCFIADGGFEPWTGSDILIKGIGGSETYIIEMARYIQKQGLYKVIVFCNCLKQSTFEGVEYIEISKYPAFVEKVNIDTCIISRFSEYIPVSIYGKTKNVYLVLHDLTPSGQVIPIHEKLKKIFCLSEWHVSYFLQMFPHFKDITIPFYYGIDIHKFDSEVNRLIENNIVNPENNNLKTKKIPYKFIYSSFPNRGLLQLLRMWPKIVDKYQDASLHIYSDINGKWVNGVAKEMMNDIRLLLNIYEENDKTSRKKLNIFYYGWVNKSVLADAWKTSEYWFYPCTFMETFCLTAVEAALSKTIAITNGLAALQNTVSDRGICIPGDATTEEWQNRALNELFLIMNYKNKERREEFIEKNYEWACKLSWENQANNLLKIFLQN